MPTQFWGDPSREIRLGFLCICQWFAEVLGQSRRKLRLGRTRTTVRRRPFSVNKACTDLERRSTGGGVGCGLQSPDTDPAVPYDYATFRPMLLARGLTYLGWAADRSGDETSEFILEYIRPLVVDLAEELVRHRVTQ